MRFFPWKLVRADTLPPRYESTPRSPTSTPVSDKPPALPLPTQPLRRAKPPPNRHAVVSENQNFYTGGAAFVAMGDQTTEHRDRPVVIAKSQYFIDVNQHLRQGATICMLASYCDIKAALCNENDEQTAARLRQYMDKIQDAAAIMKGNIEGHWTRGASVDEEHFKYWYICHIIACLSAKSVKVTLGGNDYTGILVKATLDQALDKMILSGIQQNGNLLRVESHLGEVDNWHAQVEVLDV